MNISEVFEYSMEGFSDEDEDASIECVAALSNEMSELSRKVLNGEDVNIEPSRVHTYVVVY
ncbi:hypothetical protein [Pseudomonas vanderleydeniana]|uniref:Uncharacterized protein n=1 Tax=Pseudomonas vanderleydeniana TaxID=2745495 RepID=A0A9E6PHD4_9PSED|nr:hypothetical protein [Pseudomonas vanderleydeniana]QXI26260.1 hypothetical protein HU752_020145 [Pseudomonas vanderleydeniana]